MSTQVTVTLPDDVYEGVERLAQINGRDVADVLATALAISLSPLVEQPSEPEIEALSDEAVLALADSRMDDAQNARMSALLEKQQAASLNPIEQHELSLLLFVYHEGSIRKANALAEAIRRGLKAPLQP